MLHSISYCLFDKAVGNTIACTYPKDMKLSEVINSKSIEDYCFPDGAHDSFTDCVCMILKLKASVVTDLEGTLRGGASLTTAGSSLPPEGGNEQTIASQPRSDPELFGFATYHLKKDPTVHRGATQRSMLFLSWRPLYHAFHQITKQIVFPFFDEVNVNEKELHYQLPEILFKGLNASLGGLRSNIGSGRQEHDEERALAEALLSTNTRRTRAMSAVDGQGTFHRVNKNDNPFCETKKVTFRVVKPEKKRRQQSQTTSPLAPSTKSSKESEGNAHPSDTGIKEKETTKVFEDEPKELGKEKEASGGDGEGGDLKKTTATSPIKEEDDDSCSTSPTSYKEELVHMSVHFPPSDINLVDQLSYGSSLKKLIQWFGSNIALIHFSLLSRMPVLYIGHNAEDVGEAVRATAHLIRPLPLDVSRFAPFATLESADIFAQNVSTSLYIAVGTTNAFYCENEFPGMVKCDTRSGEIRFYKGKEPRIPKNIRMSFDDLVRAANDECVKDIYVRARMCRFNLNILRQFEKKKGSYYETLCCASNLIETPLLSEGEETTVKLDSENSDFLLVDDFDATLSATVANSTLKGGESTFNSCASPQSDDIGDQDESYFSRLTREIVFYEESAAKNQAILEELDSWYHHIFNIFHYTVTQFSGESHRCLFEELQCFDPHDSLTHDPSLLYCGCQLIDGISHQARIDRNVRLRIAVEYKERCFLFIDAICKNNQRALRRRLNRYFSDFFNFPFCRQYNMPNQLLFFQTPCTMVSYVQRLKIKTSGTVYLSKNYFCFEAGALALHKRHQIFPYDVFTAVSSESSGLLGSQTIKVMMDLSDGYTCMLVLSNISNSKGFFEILQLLFHRQQRLIKAMKNIPPLHTIPREPIRNYICPLYIPVGLYTTSATEYVEEVWENQRSYPLVGWSSRMLLSDPYTFSDFSGVRERKMNDVTLPSGFEWASEWQMQTDINAKELVEDDTPPTDQCPPSFGGVDSKDSKGSAGSMSPDSQSPQLSPRSQPVGANDGFVYGTSWTTSKFKKKEFFGCVIRRRLWIRKRRLILSQDETRTYVPVPSASPLHADEMEEGESPFDHAASNEQEGEEVEGEEVKKAPKNLHVDPMTTIVAKTKTNDAGHDAEDMEQTVATFNPKISPPAKKDTTTATSPLSGKVERQMKVAEESSRIMDFDDELSTSSSDVIDSRGESGIHMPLEEENNDGKLEQQYSL